MKKLTLTNYTQMNTTVLENEFIDQYMVKANGEYVKVAVRLSGGGTLFARSLYVLNPNRVQNFIKKGTLKKV